MTDVLGILLYLMALGLLGLMLFQHVKGIHPLLSVRNFFLVGLIVYQLASAGRALVSGDYLNYSVENPVATGSEFTLRIVLFVIAYFWCYRKGWGIRWAASKVPIPNVDPTVLQLAMFAIVLSVLGPLLRFAVPIPFVSNVTDRWGVAFAAMACGVAGWIWGPRLFNPFAIAFAALMVVGNSFTVLADTFGRRNLLAIGAALIWGLFYSHWRHLRAPSLLMRLAIIALVPIFALALYTDARSVGDKDRSAGEQFSAMAEADLVSGVMDLFSGQDCGPTSLFLIEAFPERHGYMHMWAVQYFFVLPVPRDWWEHKPEPLSSKIASLSFRENVNREALTMGPGIVGHTAAEGGWYAILVYALLIGLMMRSIDELAGRSPANALMVLPAGAALGQAMGVARGELSTFAFALVISTIGAFGFAILYGKFMERSGIGALPPLEPVDEEDEAAYDASVEPA